jgi:hypothetical protein
MQFCENLANFIKALSLEEQRNNSNLNSRVILNGKPNKYEQPERHSALDRLDRP